ncbi:response regulator [Cohnella fermenti]
MNGEPGSLLFSIDLHNRATIRGKEMIRMYRLLIVDDEPSIVEGLAQMISSHELPLKEIRFAYSAGEAQEYMERALFDIVLADIRMPRISGLEWIESVRKAGWKCKVIFLTGHSDFEYTKKAIQLGVNDYLLKPVDDEEIIGSLQRAIHELDQSLDEMMSISKARQKLQVSNDNLKNQILGDLLLQPRNIPPGGSIKSTLGLLEVSLDEQGDVFLALMRIDYWGERFQAADAALIRFAIHNMTEEMLEHGFHLETISLENRLIGMLVQSDSPSPRDTDKIAFIMESVQNTVFRLLGVSLSVVFRSVPINWGELGPYYRLMNEQLLHSTGTGIWMDMGGREHAAPSATRSEEPAGSVLIEQLKSYVIHHLSEDLSLDILARRFHVNPTYLSRLFKQTTDEVLSHYITKEKMNAARQLLLQDGMKVSEAARRVGYHNPNYFAKVFRNLFGMSPQEFKAKMFL